MIDRHRGIVLIIVSWILVLGAVLGLSVSAGSRGETREVAAVVAGAKARNAAESGIWLAIDGLARNDREKWPIDGVPITVTLAGHDLKVAIQSQAGLVDLNRAPPALLIDVIAHVLDDRGRAEALTDEILDWRDPDSLVRLAGAERDAYEALEVTGAPRDGPFNTHQELRRLATISADEYTLLAPLFTVHSQRDGVAPELAPEQLLRALPGISDERIDVLLAEREARASEEEVESAPVNPMMAARVQRGVTFEVFVEAQNAFATRRLSAVVLSRARAQPPFSILAWHEGWYDREPFAVPDSDAEVDD